MIDKNMRAEDLLIDEWTKVSNHLGFKICVNLFVPELGITVPIHIPEFGGKRGMFIVPLKYCNTDVYDKGIEYELSVSFSQSDGDRSCIPISLYIKDLSEFGWLGDSSERPSWLLSEPFLEEYDEVDNEEQFSVIEDPVIFVNCSEDDFID
ncbi:MAG: hypothetical protein EOP48_13415 [Sphingobacteriales bacterium]|nr:MAG: hypothetical protein EOP48_13415 [Sphingobacteriales bacterium]